MKLRASLTRRTNGLPQKPSSVSSPPPAIAGALRSLLTFWLVFLLNCWCSRRGDADWSLVYRVRTKWLQKQSILDWDDRARLFCLTWAVACTSHEFIFLIWFFSVCTIRHGNYLQIVYVDMNPRNEGKHDHYPNRLRETKTLSLSTHFFVSLHEVPHKSFD